MSQPQTQLVLAEAGLGGVEAALKDQVAERSREGKDAGANQQRVAQQLWQEQWLVQQLHQQQHMLLTATVFLKVRKTELCMISVVLFHAFYLQVVTISLWHDSF